MITALTTWAQGCAGLALVLGFALLCARQTRSAAILLALQSAAVAIAAVAMQQPILAAPPLILATGVWYAQTKFTQTTSPVGGAKLGVGAGAILAVLCQSQGTLALPLTIVLLAVLLAATRSHSLMRVIALVALQNGIVLASFLVTQPAFLLPLACLLLPLPLAALLLLPPATPSGPGGSVWFGRIDVAVSIVVLATTFIVPLDPLASVFAPLLGLDGVLRSEARRKRHDGLLSLAPRFENTLTGRGLALLNSAALVLAVCSRNPMMAWVAVIVAMAAALPPALRQRWDQAILACAGAGILLFGLVLVGPVMVGPRLVGPVLVDLVLVPGAPSIIGYLGLFAGLATIAAVIPDLATVAVILLLRLAVHAPWPQAATALGTGMAVAALLICAVMLIAGRRQFATNIGPWATPVTPVSWPAATDASSILTDPPPLVIGGWTSPHHTGANVRASALLSGPIAQMPQSTANATTRIAMGGDSATLLLFSQVSIAALAICMGRPDGRFAALVLLILIILTRSSLRLLHGPAAPWARAGLGGVPPLGVFPGLVLAVLAITGQEPWLLLPLGLAAIPIFSAAVPRHLPDTWPLSALRSIAWVPLLLALLAGYCVPDGLSHWWHVITAGRS